uniref:Coatomer alpha subunit C-terminal domain-containing protein n=1 Tax=Cannabis sativa TaxID=3483 RepID=A0A803NN86_CANSA
MCVSFHPKKDLVVSASLDKIIRVWDISALKKKSGTSAHVDDILRLGQMNSDLFGGVDSVIKYVLEENDEGGWDLEDLELPPKAETPKSANNARSIFVVPIPGMANSQIWVQMSSLAAEHAAANSRREVDEIKELIIIVKEYVLNLKLELKRKESEGDPVQQQELAAYFTHCSLQIIHLRLLCATKLVILSLQQILQDACWRPIPKITKQKLLEASQLNYEFKNPFVVCGATYVPIYRGQKNACSHLVPAQEGQLCTVCNLAVVGSDASCLLCSPNSQIR